MTKWYETASSYQNQQKAAFCKTRRRMCTVAGNMTNMDPVCFTDSFSFTINHCHHIHGPICFMCIFISTMDHCHQRHGPITLIWRQNLYCSKCIGKICFSWLLNVVHKHAHSLFHQLVNTILQLQFYNWLLSPHTWTFYKTCRWHPSKTATFSVLKY